MPPERQSKAEFDLAHFLPYLLNQAAERIGKGFEPVYRDRYDLTRTQWRVLANLGAHGSMTAASVSRRAQTEKSKISRALTGLEQRGLLERSPGRSDRRVELLALTRAGRALHGKVARDAVEFDSAIRQKLGSERARDLQNVLVELAGLYEVG